MASRHLVEYTGLMSPSTPVKLEGETYARSRCHESTNLSISLSVELESPALSKVFVGFLNSSTDWNGVVSNV